MTTATLYKITNIVNKMCYYGIVYKKGKTIEERFEEHMEGKGGVHLYNEGVLKFGKENFIICALETGELDYIRDKETQLNANNLHPKGYNGCSSHAIIISKEKHSIITEKKRLGWETGAYPKPIPPNWKGKKRSESMRTKLSESKKGIFRTKETKEKISKSKTGQTPSEETREKMRISHALSGGPSNKRHWLLISPNKELHYTFGNIQSFVKTLGLSYSKLFVENLNTGIPIKSKRRCPLSGWMVYDEYETIMKIIQNETEVN